MADLFGRTALPICAQEITDAGLDADSLLATEVILSVFSVDGRPFIRTCYGDICKTVNALMDYANLLELVCDEWQLNEYHKSVYELRAEKLRKIARHFETSIGYDYLAALRKCEQMKKRRSYDAKIGGDALCHAVDSGKGDAQK